MTTSIDDRSHTTSPIQQATLAALLLGAGIIHLVMVPMHMAEWRAEGYAFLFAGALQLLLALMVLWSPRRWVSVLTILTSAAFIGAWAVTRIQGSPWGPSADLRQPATFIDITCATLEGAAILFAAFSIWRPRWGSTWSHDRIVMASVVPMAIVLLSAAAIASPSASNHAHANGGCPKDYMPNPELTASDGHSHGGSNACVLADDRGFSALSNGHHHAIRNDPLDPATQTELDRQLQLTREVAAKYPTLKDAMAAGYRPAGGYSPGLGQHMGGRGSNNFSGTMSDDNLLNPGTIIYAGTDPDSPIAGFMYLSLSRIEPNGFVGTNDTWHYHTNVCVKFTSAGIEAPFGADREDVTKEMCTDVGGSWMPITTWMVHVWSVPGWENPNGVFAEEHPRLGCSDGTYRTVPTDEPKVTPNNSCVSGAAGDPTNDGWSPLA